MVTASRLLRKAKIQEIIEKREEKQKSKRNVTRQEKLEILSEFIRDKTAFTVERKEGIEEIVPNVPLNDRIKAIDLHSKISGDLIQKFEHSGLDGSPINHNIEVTFVSTKEKH